MEKIDQSLPKSQRILKNPEFVRIQKAGRRFHSKHFILIVADKEVLAASSSLVNARSRSQAKNNLSPVNLSPLTKLGVTITKKIEPTSVRRNRVKRMVRAAFRQIKNDCLLGLSILVIAKHGSADLKMQEVSRQIYGTLKFNALIKQKKSL